MKYKTLFRLALKLMGVYFMVGGLAEFVPQAASVIGYLVDSSGMGRFPPWTAVYVLSHLVRFGLGAYLFFGGVWLIDKAIPGDHAFCPQCGYDLTGTRSSRCPECGTPFAWEDVRPGRPPETPEQDEEDRTD